MKTLITGTAIPGREGTWDVAIDGERIAAIDKKLEVSDASGRYSPKRKRAFTDDTSLEPAYLPCVDTRRCMIDTDVRAEFWIAFEMSRWVTRSCSDLPER